MRQVNIHDAKTQLSRLVAEAVRGDPFVIARAGTPLVEVRALPRPVETARRIGFLAAAGPQAPVKAVGPELIDLIEGGEDGGG
jgi:antitoxin (DNA-binding transcriptional repressor) of toxin-antitoxin stability system